MTKFSGGNYIELRDVSLSFGEKKIFEKLSIKIPKDQITCVSGVSGRGKTTLLRLIARLTSPDSGELLGLPENPAFMFQEDRLLPWLSALKNVSAVTNSKKLPEDYPGYWLEKLGLSNDKNLLPAKMSGGMRRRAALARALFYDGDFLLLDEPFTGLDPSMTETAAGVILSRGLPAVVVTHSVREAELLGGHIITI